MFDRLTSSPHRVRNALAAAGALFLAILVLLSVQMALGRDPAVRGERSASGAAPTAQPQVRPEADDDWEGDDGWGAGAQQQVPEQPSAPLQSGAS